MSDPLRGAIRGCPTLPLVLAALLVTAAPPRAASTWGGSSAFLCPSRHRHVWRVSRLFRNRRLHTPALLPRPRGDSGYADPEFPAGDSASSSGLHSSAFTNEAGTGHPVTISPWNPQAIGVGSFTVTPSPPLRPSLRCAEDPGGAGLHRSGRDKMSFQPRPARLPRGPWASCRSTPPSFLA